MKFINNLQNNILVALMAGVATMLVAALAFLMLEPTVGRSQSEFVISQTITDESSFSVVPTDVTMSGTISGVSGGSATGTTQFVVQSNNATGYYVEIDFFDNGTEEAMSGDVTGSESLRDYDGDVAGEPSYGFTASSASLFAYTVMSTTSTDTDDSFDHDGSANCNTGGNDGDGSCWMAPTTTAFRIIDKGSASVSGATSTVQYLINVPSGAVPVPQAETYTATSTITLFTQ